MIAAPLFASLTATVRFVRAAKVSVAVVEELVFCEFTAAYWNVTVVAAAQFGAHVGTATNEPFGFSVTVPPVAATVCGSVGQVVAPVGAAQSGRLEGSVSLTNTPGGLICSREAMLLV